MKWLQILLENKHTSGAAFVLFGLEVGAIIWPQHKEKFDQITKLTMMYGLAMSGDSRPKQPTGFLPMRGPTSTSLEKDL